MAKTNEHGRLIAAAAKAALVPLGSVRKGQSRVWYSDQRYWVIAVEFQPSCWSKGSYLNVSVAWLWKAIRGYSFRYRPFDFISFESVEQFTPLIAEMANVAAREVVKIRKQFASYSDIHDYIVRHANRDSWPIYHAAISSALAGDIKRTPFFREDGGMADARLCLGRTIKTRQRRARHCRSASSISVNDSRKYRKTSQTYAPAARPKLPRCIGFHSRAMTTLICRRRSM